MNPRLERAVVRLAGFGMFALAVTAAIRTDAPANVPSWALRSSLVYSLELILATVSALYALLTVAVHTVVRGSIPTAISKEGFTWAQTVTKEAEEAIASAREQLESFEVNLTKRDDSIAPGRENAS